MLLVLNECRQNVYQETCTAMHSQAHPFNEPTVLSLILSLSLSRAGVEQQAKRCHLFDAIFFRACHRSTGEPKASLRRNRSMMRNKDLLVRWYVKWFRERFAKHSKPDKSVQGSPSRASRDKANSAGAGSRPLMVSFN